MDLNSVSAPMHVFSCAMRIYRNPEGRAMFNTAVFCNTLPGGVYYQTTLVDALFVFPIQL